MKKILLILFMLQFISCSNIPKPSFTSGRKFEHQGFSFEVGDVILVKKRANPFAMFGHCAIVYDDGKVAEYPRYGYGCISSSLPDWLSYFSKKEIIVLRANLTETQKEEINFLVYKYSKYKYGVIHSKLASDEFYCSSYIYKIYYDLGIKISDFKFLILPYDLYKSPVFTKLSL